MSEFHFLRPWWFLALLPVFGLLIALWRRRGSTSAWRRVLEPALLDRLWLEPPGRLSRLPLWLLGLGWLLAVLALAGPAWERQPEPVWQTQTSRVLILDLSPSMNVADLAPSRLERARFKILDVLAKSREGRAGLVVFGGEAHTVTPLTDDGETIANLLSALSTEILPVSGDLGASALELAGDLLQQAGAKQGELLLFSDGMADPATALAVARQLRVRGYRLSVLGVGTAQGAPVPRAGGGFGRMARLPLEALQELAHAGGGVFSLMSADDRDLARVLLEPDLSTPLQAQGDSGVERWIEQGVWLLPILLLLAATGFRRGWLAGVLAIMILPPPAQAFEWRDLWWRADQQAARALQQGQSEVAAERFTDPAWRGMARYQAGDYAAAAKAFERAGGVEAGYNRGNALARAGQFEEAMEAYRQVLDEAPQHADARANLELLERLMQQEQQQDQSDSSSQDSRADQDGQQQSRSANDAGQQDQQQGEAQDQQQQGEEQAPGQQQTQGEQEGQAEGTEPQQADASGSETGQDQRDEQQPEDSMEAARRDLAERSQQQQEQTTTQGSVSEQTQLQGETSLEQEPPDEQELALKQWLRQIPEDPAGLLRRKFMVEHLTRMRNAQ
jgi:Ca-activated chloride channel family protein